MIATDIYNLLCKAGMTPAGACGMLGNMHKETGGTLSAIIVERGRTGYSDIEYTHIFNASPDLVISDRIGYGLCQWTLPARKQALRQFADNWGVGVGEADMQVMFAVYELQTDYKTLWDCLCVTESVEIAATRVCEEFERPAGNTLAERVDAANKYYEELKGGDSVSNVQDVINIATAEVGYHEKASNASLNDATANAGSGNYNKYANELDSLSDFYNGRKNGFAWCDIFVDWCFYKAYGRAEAQRLLCQPNKSTGAGCTYSLQFYKNAGQFYTSNPRIGDQIFFGKVGNSDHTGLVYKVDANNVYTIEGNTSDCVAKRVYALSNSNIAGYGRPKYTGVVASAPTQTQTQTTVSQVSVSLPVLKLGATGPEVKSMQQLLTAKKYSCGVIDGDFGSLTKEALKNFQAAKGLTKDGECGANTWSALIRK